VSLPCGPAAYGADVRTVDLAVYADSLAAEAAALQARLERARARLRQAAIEREAREALPAEVVARLRRLGLLEAAADVDAMDELEELQRSRAALEQLQAWVEARLFEEREGASRAHSGLAAASPGRLRGDESYAAARFASPASSAER
jgi:hypothetical protein